jgi:hypothetical protein
LEPNTFIERNQEFRCQSFDAFLQRFTLISGLFGPDIPTWTEDVAMLGNLLNGR